MTDERLSEETVNAFVDGELDRDERLHILGLSEAHGAVRRQLCETRTLKDLMEQAYAEVPTMDRSKPVGSSGEAARRSARVLVAAVAAVMFLAGILAGQFLPDSIGSRVAHQDPVFLDLGELVSFEEAKDAHGDNASILLHLATNDVERVEDALAKVEQFVGRQRQQSRRVELEVVANGAGLDLLRVARTPYEARFKQIARDDYVTVLACRQAVQRLRERGVSVDLIPEADMATSALDRIIRRLREGWVYVKV